MEQYVEESLYLGYDVHVSNTHQKMLWLERFTNMDSLFWSLTWKG